MLGEDRSLPSQRATIDDPVPDCLTRLSLAGSGNVPGEQLASKLHPLGRSWSAFLSSWGLNSIGSFMHAHRPLKTHLHENDRRMSKCNEQFAV